MLDDAFWLVRKAVIVSYFGGLSRAEVVDLSLECFSNHKEGCS